jgi:hypothetical protein
MVDPLTPKPTRKAEDLTKALQPLSHVEEVDEVMDMLRERHS